MKIFISPEMMESLASLEHIRWSDWMRYLFGKSQLNDDGSVTIPAALVDRWTRQHSTPYDQLPEGEKESDRKGVRRYLTRLQDAECGITLNAPCEHNATIEDGFGNVWSATCLRCHHNSMVVMRPGDARCLWCE